jgi:hypothetical protein
LGVSDKSNALLAGCSELTGNKKLNAQKKRLEFVEKRKEANLKALRVAAQKARVVELE